MNTAKTNLTLIWWWHNST